MAVNGRFEDIGVDDLHAVGERHDVPGYRRVVREVTGAVDAWPEFAVDAEIAAHVSKSIAEDIENFRPR
jgi:serine/threonine-protein kinase HipA